MGSESIMSRESLDIQCEHCHSIEYFKLGPDGAENIEQAANNHVQGKTQIQAKSIIRKHSIDRAEYAYALYTCPACKTLYNPYAIKIEYDEIMLFQPFYKCQKCNTTLVKAEEPYTSYACKHCGL